VAGAAGQLQLPLQRAASDSYGTCGLQQHLHYQQQQQQQLLAAVTQAEAAAGVGFAEEPPEVQVQHSSLFNYWLVTIQCKDRNKLFFDTVCTLCDMRYDIFHATIDGEPSGRANQLFYIRPR
jgi:hypothetical protein